MFSIKFFIIGIIFLVFIFQTGYILGVMHIGAPSCGMNPAVRAFVKNSYYRGDKVIGIHEGIDGLIKGLVS